MRALIQTSLNTGFTALTDTLMYDAATSNVIFTYPYATSSSYRHTAFTIEESGRLEKLLFYFARKTGNARVRIVLLADSDGYPGNVIFSTLLDSSSINTLDTGTGWTEVDVSAQNVNVLRGETIRAGYFLQSPQAGDSLHILADDGSFSTGNSWERNDNVWTPIQNTYGTGYNLRIRAVVSRVVTPVEISADADAVHPERFDLLQSYPNPFNGQAHIVFTVRQAGAVSITVYSILGSEVCTVLDRNLPAGVHTAVWDGRGSRGADLASGVYIVVLKSGDGTVSRKMILLR